MEISKDRETGEVVTISRVLLPALKREQHGSELSCEVSSTKVSEEKIKLKTFFFLPKVVHPGSELPLWVKAMLNIGCKSNSNPGQNFPSKRPLITGNLDLCFHQ